MTATEWVASLSPWPEEFGLDRMHALLDLLGNPQTAFRSVHVVGTNGKSTATRTIAALLRTEGLLVGAYTSPHVSGWHERLDADRSDVRAGGGASPRCGRERRGDPVRDAHGSGVRRLRGARRRRRRRRGGARRQARRDECPRRAPRAADERRPRAHGCPRRYAGGDRPREARRRPPRRDGRAAGRRVARPRAHGVHRRRRRAARRPKRSSGARSTQKPRSSLPGRLERRGPDEIRDGAHTPEAVEWLLARIEPREWTIVASILARQGRRRDAVERLASAGRTLDRDAQQQPAGPRRGRPRRPREAVLRPRRKRRRASKRIGSGARATVRCS